MVLLTAAKQLDLAMRRGSLERAVGKRDSVVVAKQMRRFFLHDLKNSDRRVSRSRACVLALPGKHNYVPSRIGGAHAKTERNVAASIADKRRRGFSENTRTSLHSPRDARPPVLLCNGERPRRAD